MANNTPAAPRGQGRQHRIYGDALRERDRQMFALRIAGVSFADIARQFGLRSHTQVITAYERHMARLAGPDSIEEQRQLELQRLEDMRAAIYTRAVGDPGDPTTGRAGTPPDLEAIQRLLQIHDRKVRLLGLHREPTYDPEEELRRLAEAEGLDPADVIREADGIIAMKRGRWTK